MGSIAGPQCIGAMPLSSIASCSRKGAAEARYHGVAEVGIAVRDIASVIGRRLNVPVVAMSNEEAANHFGWFVHFAGMDMPALSERTQERLGWQPKHPGLIADLDGANYFTN